MIVVIDDDMYANEMIHIELTPYEASIIANEIKHPRNKSFYPALGMPVMSLIALLDLNAAEYIEKSLDLISSDILNFYLDSKDKVEAREQFKLKADNELITKILVEVIKHQ